MVASDAGPKSEPKKKNDIVESNNRENEINEEPNEDLEEEIYEEVVEIYEECDEGQEEEIYEEVVEIYEESDEDPKDKSHEELEEDPEEEIDERPKEDPEQEVDEEPEEDPEEEVDEEPEEDLNEDPEEDQQEEIEEDAEDDPPEEIEEDTEEDPQEEIEEDPEEDPQEEIEEDPEEDLQEEIEEDPEEDPQEEIEEDPEEDPQEEIEEDPEEDPQEEVEENPDEVPEIEEPEKGPSSKNNACTASNHLEDASKSGLVALEACESKNKLLTEECLKSESDVTSSVIEHDGENGHSKFTVNGERASEQQENGGSSGKRKQSRWDVKQVGETSQVDGNSKRRKTRWDNDDGPENKLFKLASFIDSIDSPELRLNMKLVKINKQIQSLEAYNESPPEQRSPSPQPQYNDFGERINTSEARIMKKLEKLRKKKNNITSKLARSHLIFGVPAKPIKPRDLVKKIFVPVTEYPNYNFIGLILGPNGNTLKKMEKETGTRIFLRGKGSRNPNPSEGDKEADLHVRVEADNQHALDSAVAMIEKLLIPVDDQMNDHKKAQLTELAKLRGTYNNICTLCKEEGHKKYACPLQVANFNAVCCDVCGSFGHLTSNCSVPSSKSKSNKEVDPTKLYVGYLSQAIDEKRLKELFMYFGNIAKTTVIKDQITGLSKGYGFVKFESPSDAADAVRYMNGYKLDGKTLAVRVAGQKLVPGPVHLGQVAVQFPFSSSYPGPIDNVSRTEALNVPRCANSSTVDPRLISNFPLGSAFSSQMPSSSSTSSQFPGFPSSSSISASQFPGLASSSSSSASQFPGLSSSSSSTASQFPGLPSSSSISASQFPSIPSSLSNPASHFPGSSQYQNSQFNSYLTSPTMYKNQKEHISQMPETDQQSSFWSTFRFS